MDEAHYRLHDFLEYSVNFKRNAPKTVREIKACFMSLYEHADKHNLNEFDAEAIEHWIIIKRKTLDWAEKTVHTRLTYLSLFADWLVRKKVIEKNPVKEVDRPRLPKTLPRALSEKSCLDLLDWVKSYPFRTKFERYRGIAIIAMFIGTGMRYEEVCNLKIADVDMELMEVSVRRGKGKKDRMIPIRKSLCIILQRYLAEKNHLGKTCPHFFASSRYNNKMGDKVIYQLCWKLRDESKIQFTPHMLRHSYATQLLRSGANIRTVQELLGHSDIKVTALYLAVTGEYLKEEVKAYGMDV